MPVAGEHNFTGPVSQAADGSDSAQSQWPTLSSSFAKAGGDERSQLPELLWLTAPEIVVVLAALVVLVLDLSFLRRSSLAMRFRVTPLVACIGCVLALLVLLKFPAQGELPAGMLAVNPMTQLVEIALLALAILVLLLVSSARFTTHVGEYCALILFATTAMMLLVSTRNLLVIFITIEFLSLSLYILTAFDKQSRPSAEAGLKVFFSLAECQRGSYSLA